VRAVAFFDYGRWVADCPAPNCTNALALERGQATWLCRWVNPNNGNVIGCGASAPIAWPADPEAVEASLIGRPESAQHWKPDPADV
jgi:hypothetical protein